MNAREIAERLQSIADALDLRGGVTITFTYDGPLVPMMQGLRVYANGEQVIGWEKLCAEHEGRKTKPDLNEANLDASFHALTQEQRLALAPMFNRKAPPTSRYRVTGLCLKHGEWSGASCPGCL